MAEALGTASAIITIWDLVDKARRMHHQIKSAPDAWKLYCDGLESLAHVQSVVKDIIQSTPHMAIPIIEGREGKSQNLVSFVNENLEIVRKQAANILDQHDLATNRSISAKRFFEWLKFYKESYLFVLDEQEIGSLREAVESAKSTLQLALQLLATNKFFSGEKRMEEELKNIHHSMRKQAVALEAIEKNKKLSQIPLKVNCGKGTASQLKKVKTASMLRLGRPMKKSNRAFKALVESGTVTVSQLVESEAQPSPGTVSQVITLEEQDDQAKTKERTRDPDLVEAKVGIYETKDEETGDKWEDQQDDNPPFPSESLIVVRRERPHERQYDLVWRDGDIFSIGIDTDMYKAAFGAHLGDYQTNPIFRLDDLLENLTDAEQGSNAQNDLEDLSAFELPSSEEPDAEPATENLSIEINCQSPTYAFIGNSFDLSLDILDTTTSLPFCVWVICDLQSCQMFVLQEPCTVACKHVRLEVMDISTLQRGPHYTMTFRSMGYGMLLNEEPAIVTHTELKLESLSTCQKKNGCPHTVVEGAASPEACCVRPVSLRAWLGEDIVEMEEVASIDDGFSYDDSISVNSTLEYDGEDNDDNGDEVDEDVKDDEDEEDDEDDEDEEDDDNNNDKKQALNLLQAVMSGMANSSNIPARIGLSVLVSYVKMVDKDEFGEIYLSRALGWVDALLPSMSTSFDEDAMAWLWILWRFHIPWEFKRLSAVIAQQATDRISLEHDIHGVEIPAYIIDSIEQKRIHALSRIKAGVDREIEFCKDYANSVQQNRSSWGRESQIRRSTMIVSYLTLETQIHLPDVEEGYNPTFNGISFESTADWIRSMINSGDLMIRAMSPVMIIPRSWAHLWSYVLGDDLREAEDTTVVSHHVQKELLTLITRLEYEDWGLDLDHVSHETDI